MVYAVVFCTVLYGYWVFYYAVYRELNGVFASPGSTIYTLFAATINNFDNTFSEFVGSPYRIIGIVVLIVFIITFSILLLNLLIARMSASHEKINENSFREWLYTKAEATKQ